VRDQIDEGLSKPLAAKSGYVDLHAEAVGKLLGPTVAQIGVEAGYKFRPNLGLYVEANALTDRSWNAGAGLRWTF
jgi:hypothetical protein